MISAVEIYGAQSRSRSSRKFQVEVMQTNEGSAHGDVVIFVEASQIQSNESQDDQVTCLRTFQPIRARRQSITIQGLLRVNVGCYSLRETTIPKIKVDHDNRKLVISALLSIVY
jgi:hypothetical protein